MAVHAAFPPEPHTSMMSPAYASSSPPGSGVKTATVVFGVLGMIVFSISIGFLIGWDYGYYSDRANEANIYYFNFLSIPANAAMLYVTSRILYLVNESDFPRPGTLSDLSRCVSRLLAFSLMGFGGWITSIVWVAIWNTDNFWVYHACNYGFIFGFVVTGLAGSLVNKTRKALRHTHEVHPAALKHPATVPYTYHNQAFAPPYTPR